MTKKSPFYHVLINWVLNIHVKIENLWGGDCGLCEMKRAQDGIGRVLASSVD